MKFNIFNYSQQGAISLKLDLKDLLILDWFQTFQPRMHKIIHEYEQYYWISYDKVLQDIPILEITTEKGLYKRLQNLCEIGILKHHTKRTNGGCYSYYLITDMIKFLISPESSFANAPKVPLQSPESSQQKDSSIINSSIINNCNARQSNFSKNEGGGQNIPTLKNSSSSEIPNNSTCQESLQVETYEPLSITEEEYKAEWEKINDRVEPSSGFKRNYENFKRCCNVNVQKEHGGWKNYLASEWIPKEKYLKERKKGKKPEISEPCEDKPPALTTLTTDLRNKPETFQALNQKFHEALKRTFGDTTYYTWFRFVEIVGFDRNVSILLIPKVTNRLHLHLHYENRLKTIIKKVCEKHFKKEGFKLNDYKLVLEEELTKKTNNLKQL